MNIPYHNKALPKGTILREWALEDVLGVGGFGIVYRGKGIYFGEEVAIKEYFPGAISDRLEGTTVAPTDSSSEEIYALGLQKFLEEAKVLWGLSKPDRHPNIVSVRSLFEIHGTAYMVMDFERGTSLSQMLKDGRKFDEASLMALLKPIAEGLDRAHRAGVVHRDIKPANILVDEGGRPVLIDFGSARFESGQATNTKVTFYTPPYAAIEQYVKTYPQGPWTDIYALGVVLYQCVSGEKPLEVLERMHGDEDRRLSERQWPGFSPAFIRAIDAAMAIRPLERPPSIAAWLALFDVKDAALADNEATRIGRRVMDSPTRAAVRGASVVVPAVPVTAGPAAMPRNTPPRRLWLFAAAMALALLAAAGLAAHRLLPQRRTAPTIVAMKPVTLSQPATSAMEDEAAGLLADARRLGRPAKEIAALTDSNAKIATMATQLKGLGQTADSMANAAPLHAQMNDLAANMARGEATALARAGKSLARDMEQSGGNPVAADAAAALAAADKAKGGLDDAVAIALKAQDATLSLKAARQSLTAYNAFAIAYTAALQFYISARRSDYIAQDTAARATYAKLAAFGKVTQPWLLASKARKQAYQELVANATQATAQLALLDKLYQATATAKDLKQLSAALVQASAIKATLDDLLTKSTADSVTYNQ